MAYKKLRGFEFNKKNPFIDETIHHIDKGQKMILMGNKDGDLMVGKDGEVKGHSVFAQRLEYDKAEFRKIYMSSLEAFFDLSKAAMKIFTFIMSTVEKNNDQFIFSLERCKNFTGYSSKKAINTGLSELLENKFIARGENPYIFYINPTIFFNGDRITFLKQLDFKEKKELQSKKLIQ